jgi:hypothetical protein
VGPRSLSKDVKNKAGAINNSSIELLLEIALLGRAEAVVDEYDFGTGVVQELPQLLHLAGTDEVARIELTECGRQCACDFSACGQGKCMKFVTGILAGNVPKAHVHENCPFAVTRSVKQGRAPEAAL